MEQYAIETDTTAVSVPHPDTLDDALSSVLREGACRLLVQAVATSGNDLTTLTSAVLPKWALRPKSLDALAAFAGKDAPNLPPSVIGRLWPGSFLLKI